MVVAFALKGYQHPLGPGDVHSYKSQELVRLATIPGGAITPLKRGRYGVCVTIGYRTVRFEPAVSSDLLQVRKPHFKATGANSCIAVKASSY
jgi:hypothetical protein